MVTESIASASSAPPLNLPAFLAWVTVPVIGDPVGITILASIVIGVATEPVNAVPTWLVFDPRAWPVRIVNIVPAGTPIGGGGGGGATGVRAAASVTGETAGAAANSSG